MHDFITAFRYIFESRLFNIGKSEITLLVIIEFFLLILIFFILSKILRRFIIKKLLIHLRLEDSIRFVVLRLVHFAIMFIGLIVALNSIGLNLTSLNVGLGVLGVGIAFGLQNITSNFISGIILMFERHVNVGDYVTVQNVSGDSATGQVRSINIRSATIVTLDNITLIVPNSKFIENTVTNWSVHDPKIRITIPVGVAYGSDTGLVTELLLKAAKGHEEVLDDPSPVVIFKEFGNSSLNFELRVWIPQPMSQVKIISDLNYAINDIFANNGISIPFPQRDIHIIR